ncbi:MAG: HAD-IB family hydrolase [Actinobacteria bacterium]|nr:HAD-IB family hydrolase [Actinomycetota bacterium]
MDHDSAAADAAADAAGGRPPTQDRPDGSAEPSPVLAQSPANRSETAERLARETPDQLSDEVVEAIARRSTGATQAAFFDLDKTILARSSALAFGREMYRDGLVGTTTLLKGMYAQFMYTLQGADHEKMESMRVALLQVTKGWEAERVARIVRETLEEVIVPVVYGEALQLIDEHGAAARDLWLVSSSGEEVVRPIADHLGIPEIIATRSRVDEQGRFDGTLQFYAYGQHKATALRQIAEARGYDLDRCHAYSDSITDLAMLSAVGNPVAVNPDRELRAAARAMGWPIRDFHSPVTLRSHLPDPPSTSTVLVGIGVAAAAGATAWYLAHRETT